MNQNNPNIDKLISMVGKKLNKNPEVLKKQLDEGKYDSVLGNLSDADNKKLQTLLKNPKLAQQVINTPEAQKMLKNILGE